MPQACPRGLPRPKLAGAAFSSGLRPEYGVVLPERLDVDSVLFWSPRSRFLGRLIHGEERERGDGEESHGEDAEEEKTRSAKNAAESEALIRHAIHKTIACRTPRVQHPKLEIEYRSRELNFAIRHVGDRLRISNQNTVWLSHGKNKSLSLGLRVDIPPGCFALALYRTLTPRCYCATDVIEPGNVNPEIQIVNAAGGSYGVDPGCIDGIVRIYPFFIPEPWEVVNLESPIENTYFVMRLRSPMFIAPFLNSYVTLDCTHICPRSCVLVIGTRHLNRLGVIVNPVIWLPGTMPVLHLVNKTSRFVRFDAGTPVARAIFTSKGFCTGSSSDPLLGQFLCPKTRMGFSRRAFLD